MRRKTADIGRRARLVGAAVLACALCAGARAADIVIQFDAAAYEPFKYNPDSQRELVEMDKAVKEFESRHPGVRVEYVVKPAIDPEQWLTTRFMSNNAPDIVNLQAEFCSQHLQKGWFVPLDRFLEEPNPHVPPGLPGHERWLDQFYRDATDARRAPDGRLYVIPYDQVGTAVFYNRDLFAEVGVTEANLPRTWAEFLDLQRKLKDRFWDEGIYPFCMTGGFDMRFNWSWRIFLDQLYDELLPQIDVRTEVSGGFAGVDSQEFVRAYKKGILRVDSPRFLAFFQIMRDWAQYWQPGFLGVGDDKLFRLGQAAMFWDGSWAIGMLERDKLRTFDYGVMAFPGLTRETTPFVTGSPPRSVGGATAIQWAVTDTARKKGRLDLVIDLLRTITAPHFAGPIISEAELFPPNIKGVETSPKMEAFLSDLEAGHVLLGDRPELSGELGDLWFRMMQSWLGGAYTEEDLIRRLRFMFDAQVDRLLLANRGTWRFSADWEILPVDGVAVVAGTSDGASVVYNCEADGDGCKTLPVAKVGGDAPSGGCDVDNVRREVYWCAGNAIYRRGIDEATAPVERFLDGLAGPADVAVDSRHRKLYWAERDSGTIRVADLDARIAEVLFRAAPDDAAPAPQALVCDADEGVIYWSVPAAQRVYRATFAVDYLSRKQAPVGPARSVLEGLRVADLAFDADNRLLFLCEGNRIHRASAPHVLLRAHDGTVGYATGAAPLVPELLFETEDAAVTGLDVDPRGVLFWTGVSGDGGTRVARANLDGSDMRVFEAPVGAGARPAYYGAAEPQPLPQTTMIGGYLIFVGTIALLFLVAMTVRRDPAGTWRWAWRKRTAYLFIAPTFLFLFSLAYYPIIAALLYAFTEWSPSGQVRWVGLDNFFEVLADPVIRESVFNMVIIMLFSISVGTLMPLLAAELVFNLKSQRAQYWYRVLFVVPMVVPGVVMLLVWQLMYDYNLGVFNRILEALDLPGVPWISSPRTALLSLLLIGFPFVSGFGMLVYYAGLQSIPRSVIESASLDGASGFSRFLHFDLPLVMGQVKLMLVFSVIGSIQGFQNQLIVTAGGPGYSTMVPGLHMYQNAMKFDRMGYACAIGTVLFIVILTLTILNMKYLRSSTEFEAD